MFLLRRCVTKCTLSTRILNPISRRCLYRHRRCANLENVAEQPLVTVLFGRILASVHNEKCRFTTNVVEHEPMSLVEFEKVSDETLESLTEYFEELIETVPHLDNADVSYSVSITLIVCVGNCVSSYCGTFYRCRENRNPNRVYFLAVSWN